MNKLSIKNKWPYCKNLTDEFPYAMEILENTFDGALKEIDNFRNESWLVYGGALRDIVAGIDIQGDLDILSENTSALFKTFLKSTKWAILPNDNSYSNMCSIKYKNLYNRIVNVIEVPIKGITNKVLNTDIVCCCFVMDSVGNLYETMEGAYEDCKNKILRLNPDAKNLDKKNVAYHISKLEKRGWKSVIDIDNISEAVDKNKGYTSPSDIVDYRYKKMPMTYSYTFTTGSGSSSTTANTF